jgi:hypothetical protein
LAAPGNPRGRSIHVSSAVIEWNGVDKRLGI